MEDFLTPSQIVAELDKYIIGQGEAKKSVAIALRNRWRRLNAREDLRKEIIPNNILMIGPTGVGKTEIARRLAQLADAPFVKVEASKFTEVGYVGRDVESMIRDLVEQSVNLVKAERTIEIEQKALENAFEILLDILIPPIRKKKNEFVLVDDKEDEEKENKPPTDAELNERTREKFREKLKNGDLDQRKVELEVTIPSSKVQIMGPNGMDGMDGLQDVLSGMMPKKKKKRTMTVEEAKEYLKGVEAEKLIDMDSVTREALERAGNSGMIFIDEIDKIAGSKAGARGGPDVSREGVQRDLLPIVEGSVVNTKFGAVRTDHILFIAAGAFHVSKPSDLIPEFQGRFPIRVELNSLSKEDFVSILTEPRNALTKQYQALFESEGVELTYEDESIAEIAEIAFLVNQEIENIGARRLHTIMSNLLHDLLFEVPDQTDEKSFTITKEMVNQKMEKFTTTKDLSHYIL